MAHEHNSRTVRDEPDWGEVDKTALPRIAFADMGDADKKSTWKYPHHWVKGGTEKDEDGVWGDGELFLHRGGLNAAWAAANGARSGRKAPPEVLAHLQEHRKALGAMEAVGADEIRPDGGRGALLLERFSGTPWAIVPEKLTDIAAVVDSRIERIGSIEWAADGRSGLAAADEYEVLEDGTAIIPLYGTLMKRANIITNYSGGTSMEIFASKVRAADLDPRVTRIVLDVDSPGGTVDGTHEAMEAVRRAEKPVIAYTDGLMASAAYWIASAADLIAASPSAEVGSVGVIAMHYDRSGADQKAGLKRTPIYAGRHKAVGSDALPLDEDSRAVIQSLVDAQYNLFVSSIAANRAVTKAWAMEEMADGRIWIASEAKKRGFIDFVGYLDDVLTHIDENGISKKGAEMELTKELLLAEHPDLYNEIYEEGCSAGRKEADALINEAQEEAYGSGYEAGIREERERVTALLDAEADREATLKAIRDGISVESAFKMFYEAERRRRVSALNQMADDAPEPAGAVVSDDAVGDPEAKVRKYMGEGMSRTKALKRLRAEHPDLYEIYSQQVGKNIPQ